MNSNENLLRRLAIFQSQVGQFTRALVMMLYVTDPDEQKIYFDTCTDELEDIYVQWKEMLMDLGHNEVSIIHSALKRYEEEKKEHDISHTTLKSNFLLDKKYVSPMQDFRE